MSASEEGGPSTHVESNVSASEEGVPSCVESNVSASEESVPSTPGPDDWPNNRKTPPIGSKDYLDPDAHDAMLTHTMGWLNLGRLTLYRSCFTIRDLAIAVAPILDTNYTSLRKTLGATYLQPEYVQQSEVDTTLYRELYRLLEENVNERRAFRGLGSLNSNTHEN